MNNATSEYLINEQLKTKPFGRTMLVLIAWGATLLLSKLPLVIARDVLGSDIPWINTAWIGIAVLLWVVTYVWHAMKPLRSYFLIMGAILLLTFGFDPLVKQSAIWSSLFANQNSMTVLLGERALLTVESLIVVGILFLIGMKREQTFMTIGNLKAPLDGHTNPKKKRLSWPVFGTGMTILLGGLFFWFLSSQTPNMQLDSHVVLPLLPLILISAALNAFSEEVTYRAAPLSTLLPVVGPTHAVWLTSLWFGLGHYYGGIPSGLFGLIQTGLLAMLLGKAMLDTRGLGWSWIIHVVLDTVIYLFIAMAV